MQAKINANITNKTEKSTLVLKSEALLQSPPKDNIHEGQVSLTHGFVPFQPISPSLPSAYKEWEELAQNLPQYVSEGSEREQIKSLPLLDANNIEKLPNEYLSRAIAMIGNFAHVYYFNQRLGTDQTTDALPESVLIPWQQLTQRINRKLPPEIDQVKAVRIHYDTFLTNWNLKNSEIEIDGEHNNQIKIDDLQILSPIFANSAESNFNMTFVIMELRFAKAMQHMTHAIKAVANKNDEALIEALKHITSSIEDVTEGLDYINPNMHSEHHVDQTVWTKTVAKIDGKIPGGVSALSGSAMPLFHTLDTFIERKSYSSTMGEAMVKKYKHQPEYIIQYLSALRHDLEQYSIRDYVAQSTNPVLKNQYDLLIDAYLSENGLMGVHALKVYGYMKINFRNGRLVTNGGHNGTSTIATEPQRHIYDDFVSADSERYADYKPTQQYATRISMHTYSDKAASIVLDVSHTAMNFQPGDHCAIHPENSPIVVENFISKYNLKPSQEITLNKTWKEFFRRHFGLNADTVELNTLLIHANLGNGDHFELDALKPLAPRYYSVSPLLAFPQHLLLTVGVHKQGINSSYLMSEQTKFAIDRIPARHFHLPKSKETPILMFAAGTGISPFMGFISERAQYSDSSKNHLFFSTPDMDTFYHQEELGKAVKEGKLNLSVIFSRDEKYDTGEFTSNGFKPTTKYKGKHVDQLIEEQAKTIVDLIVNQQAKIYLCGNPGFANTVRAAIIKALSAYSHITNPTEYVDAMIADFRFNNEVYAATDYSQQFPTYYASEIAQHNKMDDCWGIINGSVYNLTRFVHTHPGGAKIVMVNAGIDMSGDYNYVKHTQRAQIEGELQLYKIGVVASPVLQEQRTITLHEKNKRFVEAFTEMENTLRNNTTYHKQKDETYLWREVFGVFVNGSLASYSKSGTGNAGSLSYALGPLLKELCYAAECSESATMALEDAALNLMSQAGSCAEYIRQSSLGSLSPEELLMKKKIFDAVLNSTFKFINKVKGLSLGMLKEIEENTDDYNQLLLTEKLDNMVIEMNEYSFILKHIVKSAPQLSKTTPIVPSELNLGCPFISDLQQKETQMEVSEDMEYALVSDKVTPEKEGISNATALSQFGFMSTPKRAKKQDGYWHSFAVGSACNII